MCGICGVFEYSSGKAVDPAHLRRMSDQLFHRGPDEEGHWVCPGVGLAVRRLSIIDVAEGHQPVSNEDGSITLVFNGEIYNYLALREELLRKGHRLLTHSDTEVIPHLYEEEGPACVERLDGMYAFALYDGRASQDGDTAGRLLLARDRMGKKPLYYADVAGALIFGSELKSILLDSRVGRELDQEALHHYLSLLVVPAPLSIFKSVRKLPPGCVLECDARGPSVRPYWKYLDTVGDRHMPEEEAVAEIRRLLFRAVEKRLMSEVPLGAFLSGGLDSSTVVAIMSRLMKEPVKTFSIGFEGPETHNELPYARALAQHCRTDHHELLARPDSIQTIEEMVRYADEPFAISSSLPLLMLSRWAREKVTVVLTGDGGDEVFAGYEHYVYERWAQLFRKLPLVTDRMLIAGSSALGGRVDSVGGRQLRRVLRFATNARHNAGQRRLGWGSSFREEEKENLYAVAAAQKNGLRPTADFLNARASSRSDLDAPTQANAIDIQVMLADEMLAKVDRMTMGASLEARCPLLDWKLVEYLASLSMRDKMPGWRFSTLKYLFRRAIGDLLPAELLTRPKHGFNVPLDHWFRSGARDYLLSVLDGARVKRRGVFRPEAVSSLVERHVSGQVNANNRLFALLVFELWAEQYL
jgi:asparagine synthase (glutamine-hydrolysing)